MSKNKIPLGIKICKVKDSPFSRWQDMHCSSQNWSQTRFSTVCNNENWSKEDTSFSRFVTNQVRYNKLWACLQQSPGIIQTVI